MTPERVRTLTANGMTVNKRELYNIEKDPWESENIVGKEEEETSVFQSLVDEFILAGGKSGEDANDILILNDDDMKKLRALGYIK